MTVQIERRLLTVREYDQMIQSGVFGEDERIELIAGEIRNMSPIGSKHAACVNRLNMFLTMSLAKKAMISIQNPIKLSDLSEPQPDVALLRPRPDFYATGLPMPTDVLLLIEVSDSTLDYDRIEKLPRYAQAGIPEVWLIDITNEVVEQYSRPRNNRYADATTLERGQTIQAHSMSELSIEVDQILGATA